MWEIHIQTHLGVGLPYTHKGVIDAAVYVCSQSMKCDQCMVNHR